MSTQTRTPINLIVTPSKQALVDEFKGKPFSALRTPALVVDRSVFARNCERMHETAKVWGADFRAHVKSHKVGPTSQRFIIYLFTSNPCQTVEGVRLQLVTKAGKTHAVIASTLMEAWQIYQSGLVTEGIVKDVSQKIIYRTECIHEATTQILYGVPIGINKIEDITALQDNLEKHGATLRLIVDNIEQISALEAYESQKQNSRRWSVFVKADCGDK